MKKITPVTLGVRASGLLLHPTSLPSPYPIGDIGPSARAFADLLKKGSQRWWQMLPIGPTGMGDSPYNALSAFAGNALLISPDDLVADGYLDRRELSLAPGLPTGRVDFGAAKAFKTRCLQHAYQSFRTNARFETFCRAEKHWLDPYASYAALKERNNERGWTEWAFKNRHDPDLKDHMRFHKFVQFLFFEQWARFRRYCNDRGIGLVGDVPIYVAHDSADVWAHPRLFTLAKDGRPSFVAGTPPDYFSKTGQWWGNPLYRWDAHKRTGYVWWKERLQHMLRLFDAVRLDHFIGFRRYWKIDAHKKTAKDGRWVKGPGEDFFETVLNKQERGKIIAEDLGATGPDVEALRDRFLFPGMKVLQFLFSPKGLDPIPTRCVVYTGTHDNDTSRGWFKKLPVHEQKRVLRVIDGRNAGVHWDLIGTAFSSPARLAVCPVQDVLGLDSEARMNTPGVTGGNWNWRLADNEFNAKHMGRLKKISEAYGRS